MSHNWTDPRVSNVDTKCIQCQNAHNIILQTMQATGGLAFGGYVRDRVANEHFKDIDIWYKTREQGQRFRHMLESSPTLQVKSVMSSKYQDYPLLQGRDTFTVFYEDQDSAHCIVVDVCIAADQVPTNDFIVNYLVFDGNTIQSSHPELSLAEIQLYISRKETLITTDYMNQTLQDLHDAMGELNVVRCAKMRFQQMKRKGWKIILPVSIETLEVELVQLLTNLNV